MNPSTHFALAANQVNHQAVNLPFVYQETANDDAMMDQLQLSHLMKLRACHSHLHTSMLIMKDIPGCSEKHLASLYWIFSSSAITRPQKTSRTQNSRDSSHLMQTVHGFRTELFIIWPI